jgi:putative peptidoglycan lipid II flippase
MSVQLVRSAGVIGTATLVSRVLGLVRDQVLAYYFGAGDAMDAFRIAFRLPNVLRDLFAEGSMSAALVPTFTRTTAECGRERAWRLGSNLLNVLVIVSGIIAVLGMGFARPLVERYASGFRDVPGKLELTITLTRIVFPFLPLVAVAAVFMAMLNACHRFFIPALSPAMFNIATIACVLAIVPIAPRVGISPIVAVAIGTLAGGIGQIAIQWPTAHREGFRYAPIVDLRDPWLGEVGRLMIPGVAGLAAVQVNLFVNSWLAAGLGTGAVSWLDYAFRLMYMPIGLFGISIATAALPGISAQAAAGDRAAIRHSVAGGLRMMLMLNVPAMIGLIVLSTPIVELIFERGRFTPADTAATAAALACYAPGLIGYSAVKLLSPAFYALGDSRIPLMASAVSVVTNTAVSVILVPVLGHRGLALGTTVAALLNAALLVWFLWRYLEGLEGRLLIDTAMKISVASAVMAIAAHYADGWFAAVLPSSGVVTQSIRTFSAIGIGIAALALSAAALRIHEFQLILGRLSAGR